MAKYELDYKDFESEKKNKQTDNAEELLDWVETVVFAFFIVILIFTFLLRNANVEGDSMLPTLNNGDRLIVSHINYTPDNGDIVIVNAEHPALDKAIVKRVIALPGQTVDIDFSSGSVKVDGAELKEDYINELTFFDAGAHAYPVQVPENCIFVMGDNRNNSTDSRSEYVGFVPVDDVLGKVVLRIFPFNRIGVPE